MYPKRSGQDGPVSGQVHTSDRIKSRPNIYGRPFMSYNLNLRRTRKSKMKTRTAASQIAKMLRLVNRKGQDLNTNSGSANLRRSTRKRRLTDSSGAEDEDLMRPAYQPLRNRISISVSRDDLMSTKRKRAMEKPTPRREGLRPRRSKAGARERLILESDDEQELSEEKVEQDETENENDVEENDADDDQNEIEVDAEGEDEGEDEGDEDDDDEEGEEEQDGRRRYDLRNRSDVRRFSMEEGKARQRSPRRVLHQGMGTKVSRDVRKGGSRVHKRHRITRPEDSYDSLLVNELDQGPAIPWGRGGSNRIDAIDGALRRPGRFDREFNFPLPGCEARAEILDIHTHRGAIVHSRPLSLVVQPCLQRHLEKAMSIISDIFPPVSVASELTKLSMLSYGSAIPLVYRPRLLLCGGEGTGLDHLGPAILHELKKYPVHSLGLPSLLSYPSAKTPEEALVHIFGEARRTTPSILYLPQFDVWWKTAHEQLRAVLLTLLEELPFDLPILLLGTSSVALAEVEEVPPSVFPHRSVYQVSMPSTKDRNLFFNHLIEAAMSVLLEGISKKSQDTGCLPELPQAPKLASGPKVSELKAKVEAEQHALRRLRMCLRDVCNWILYDKRFNAFHFPISDEDAPNYRSIIQNPMDVATILQHVDNGHYISCVAFLQDIDLIVSNAKAYNGEDYNGTRIVSRACELRDAVHGMLSQMDPALVAYCDKIASQGGPLHLPDELGYSTFPATPVVQLGTATRTSARLRHVQPEVNMDQSYDVLKRNKKITDVVHAAEDKSQDSVPSKSSQEHHANDVNSERLDPMSIDANVQGTCTNSLADSSSFDDVAMLDGDFSIQEESVKQLFVKQLFVKRIENYSIPQLERLYTRIMKGVFETKDKVTNDDIKTSVWVFLLNFVEDDANFRLIGFPFLP
ncbi:ATPase family AAA domain-containing protein At1g05910-like isoform X2 [Gastrolobium bilobum]|uniref:ATPase family AAA domain-containing protein At1g05910-like isoform X2 n=1 Tax=Gastrolobium bilobum TaxID=150636 RepID=UPI002AB0A8D9|nr:ATPase family AAA domain-containing protein At1g05910-like isoform X2 [Gastrolobium bilobum]